MTSHPDIGEVAGMISQGPFAVIAPLVADDFHGFLTGDAPMLPNPFRLGDVSRPYGIEGTNRCKNSGFWDGFQHRAMNFNVGIGTTSPGGSSTAGTAVLSLANGTAPVGGAANQSSLYAADVFTSSELFALDEAGNATQLSPHDPVTGEWIFYSKNTRTGRVVRVDMERMVKAIERVTGEQFMVESCEERAF